MPTLENRLIKARFWQNTEGSSSTEISRSTTKSNGLFCIFVPIHLFLNVDFLGFMLSIIFHYDDYVATIS